MNMKCNLRRKNYLYVWGGQKEAGGGYIFGQRFS